jgi:predicted permease
MRGFLQGFPRARVEGMTVLDESRYVLRTLWHRPSLPLLAFVTLVAGITGTTALYSVAGGLVIQSVPYPDAPSIAWITSSDDGLSPADYADVRGAQTAFSELAAYAHRSAALHAGDLPERVRVIAVSEEFFPLLRVKAILGRTITTADTTPGNDRVVVVSNGFWKARWQGASDAVGKSVELDGEKYRVAGVLPEKFHYSLAGRVDLWIPYAPTAADLSQRNRRILNVIGRVRTNYVTANQQLTAISARLSREFPQSNRDLRFHAEPLSEEIARHTGRSIVLITLGIAFGLMLIACSNVANLFLSRALDRRRQTAIQLALGAGRGRLIRQALFETCIVFGAAAAFSILPALWIVDWLMATIPAENRSYLPNYGQLSVDGGVFLVTVGVSILSGLIFGVGPALEGLRIHITGTLKELGSAVQGSRSRNRLQTSLVVLQVLLATVLLASTGLLVGSFHAVTTPELGFQPDHLLLFRVSLDTRQYNTPALRNQYWERLLEALPPGTVAARFLPFSRDGRIAEYRLTAQPPDARRSDRSAQYNAVHPEALKTMGVPLRAGRSLQASDTLAAPGVALINESLARREFPDRSPLGETLWIGGKPARIVGVTGDLRYSLYTPATQAQIYVPLAQDPPASATFALRTGGGPLDALPGIRRTLARVDANQPVWQAETMQDAMQVEVAPYRVVSTMLTGFGTLTLLLAVVGLYAVVAFAVIRRTREFGIRTALGATPADVLRLVTTQSMRMAAYGFVPGLVLAIAAGRVLESIVFEVKGQSIAPMAITIAMLALAIFAAALIPALRAARVDPLQALRHE